MTKAITIITASASFFTFCLLAMPGQVSAQEFQSERFVLDNGLTVLISEIPTSPMVAVYGLVKTGSAREGKFVGSGISHFLEHMLFKGTHERKVGEVASAIQAVGGSINASTGYDFTIYTINVPFDHVNLALEILHDMLFNATLDTEEVEKERDVVFAEMRLHKDNPDRWINRLKYQNTYQKHPYRHPVIGYRDLFAKITQADLKEYYKLHYAPNYTIVSIAGKVETDTLRPKIEELFAGLEMQPVVLDIVPQEPAQLYRRDFEYEYPTDITRVTLSYKGIPLLHEDLYAMDVLAQILGQGESSRLYQDLYKNKQLVYSIYASNYTPEDQGLFSIGATLAYEHLQEVIESALSTIEEIKKRGVNQSELVKAKRQVLSYHIKSNQKASSVAWNQGLDEAFAGDYQFSAKYVDQINKVSSKDIQRVTKHYLGGDQLITTVLKPESAQANQRNTLKHYEQGEIKRHVLENGLVVLTRKDATFPLVSLQLVFRGGLLSEALEHNGIAQLMAQTWIKGAKSLSSDEIEEQSESLGIDLNSFSGKNSFGLSMSLLSQDVDTAFDMLEKIVASPTFPEEAVNRKKKDALNAINLRDENITPFTFQTLRAGIYPKHPYGLDTLGSSESVNAITREDIQGYYRRHVSTRNMVCAVFGDIDEEDILKRLKRLSAKISSQEVVIETPQPEAMNQSSFTTQHLNKEQAMAAIGFRGDDIFGDDRYGLEVAEAILGSSFSGRLFNSIREELGKAYTMGGASIPGFETGYVFFYALTQKDSVDAVFELMKREINRLRSEPVSQQELENIKTYLKGSHKAGLELNSSLAFAVSLDELYGLGYEDYKEYDNYIDALTSQDILRIAKTYLDLERAAVVITKPQEK